MSNNTPPKPDLTGYYSQPIWSSLYIADNPQGWQKVFTIPLGQEIPRIGMAEHWPRKGYTEHTTNLVKAGELGSSIGDAYFRGLLVSYPEGISDLYRDTLEKGMNVTLLVGGRIEYESVMEMLPVKFNTPIRCRRDDYLEMRVGAMSNQPLRLKGPPILVRFTLDAVTKRDIR